MDYVRPQEVAESFLNAAVAKSKLSIFQMLVRGILSGALLGFSTSVAFTITAQGLPPVVGAVLFPVGFSIIVLLGWSSSPATSPSSLRRCLADASASAWC